LRLVDGLLPMFALFLPGGLFPRPLAIAALLLPFVGDSGLLLERQALRITSVGAEDELIDETGRQGYIRRKVCATYSSKASPKAEKMRRLSLRGLLLATWNSAPTEMRSMKNVGWRTMPRPSAVTIIGRSRSTL
jgi:hypothetical protein